MRAHDIERVPAHMRDFQCSVARSDAIDFAPDPAQPLDDFIFAPALGQQLHAYANAEKRPALAAHRLLERVHHAGHRIESAAAVGESPYSGQNNAIGGRDDLWIMRQRDRLIQSSLMGRTFKGLGRGMQIAGAIINDNDAHRCAPGSGNNPITPDGAGGGAVGAPELEAGAPVGDGRRGAGACRIQASKKRRSASSRSSPVTTPMLRQWRRASLKRRSVPASSPASSEISRPAQTSANSEAPSARKPTSTAADTRR